jgi:hypothetical protein
MRLSEAIRLGAMLKPQAFGMEEGTVPGPRTPGDVLGLRAQIGTCAMGAAVDAGWRYQTERIERLVNGSVMFWSTATPMTPITLWSASCPCQNRRQCEQPKSVIHVVTHLNDHHEWTRERIADWVETIEAQHEAQTSAPATEVVTA